jgi:hypothetical protein
MFFTSTSSSCSDTWEISGGERHSGRSGSGIIPRGRGLPMPGGTRTLPRTGVRTAMKAGTWGSEPFSEGYKRYVLAVLMLCYVANIMDRSVLSMVLEPIRHEFQASDSRPACWAAWPSRSSRPSAFRSHGPTAAIVAACSPAVGLWA